jgi:hypothetical protein
MGALGQEITEKREPHADENHLAVRDLARGGTDHHFGGSVFRHPNLRSVIESSASIAATNILEKTVLSFMC